ncbi:MAG TPA: endonuclease/exonuclease/phosphatase family protein [Patescibacteria group bacterium]|nr:endonuclease/exonuclease/phosphatase family protein [Patescibacteria group bacterium]
MKEELKIITYNVHGGRNLHKLKEILENNTNLKNADIICLQEVEDHFSEGTPRAALLAEALGYEYIYVPAREIGKKGTHGLAIITRLKILEHSAASLPFYKQIYNSRKRIVQFALLETKGKRFGISNVHLDVRLNPEDRLAQLDAAINIADHWHSMPTILVGDLNTIPVHWFKRGVPVFFKNQIQHVHMHLAQHGLKTAIEGKMRTHKAGMQLDGIYSRGIEVMKAGVEKRVRYSDHFPLWMNFKIAQ